ncbi:MAG: hypothetical protein ISS56_16150 [Anaerolineae bacterium]|nr:hypothetical protein [Anaerolineae bacterium]
MRVQRWSAIGRLALAAAGALLLVTFLLWCASEHGPAAWVSASMPPAWVSASMPPAWALSGTEAGQPAPSTMWTASPPVTLAIEHNVQGIVWPIPDYGVTITFPSGTIEGGALLTFTPQMSAPLPSPVEPVPYFFHLTGCWTPGCFGLVSLGKLISVEIQYEESELGPVGEGSLRAYYGGNAGAQYGPLIGLRETSRVDLEHNRLVLEIRNLGYYGAGGFRHMTFLPTVLHRKE